MLPIDTERTSYLRDLTVAGLCRQNDKGNHSCKLTICGLLHQKERVKHDRFHEGDGKNGLDQNLRSRPWVASHGHRCRHPDQTDTDGCAYRGETNMDVSADLRS